MSHVVMTYDDFQIVLDAVRYFNTMDKDADINLSLDRLEVALVVLQRYELPAEIDGSSPDIWNFLRI